MVDKMELIWLIKLNLEVGVKLCGLESEEKHTIAVYKFSIYQ